MQHINKPPDHRRVPQARFLGPIASIVAQARALLASQQYDRNQQDAARGIAT